MPRDTRLSLWPEQMAYYPLINSWNDIKKKDILDISECLGVHSCGLAASLLNIYHLFKENIYNTLINETKERQQLLLFEDVEQLNNNEKETKSINKIIINNNFELMHHCVDLNFFTHIKKYLNPKFHDEYCNEIKKEPIESQYFYINTLSYPIYKFNFTEHKNDRRKSLSEFLDLFVPIFQNISNKYFFKWEQFIPIIYEIAKNSADHTDQDAYMGLDFLFSNNSIKACVLIGDVGPGIYQYIRDSLIQDNPSRKGKIDFSEAYRSALKKGFSTKINSGRNKGLGIPFIVNNSIAIKAHLSIFDAYSRLILSSLDPIKEKEPPFNDIWRISHRMDGKKPFFYYIQYEVPLK